MFPYLPSQTFGVSSNSVARGLDCFCCYVLKICTTATEILGQTFNMHLLWMPVWNKYETILTTSMNHCCSSCWFSLNESSAANSTACWWFTQAEALSFVHPENIGMKRLYPGWMMQDRSCRVFWTRVSDSTAGAALCPTPGGRGWGHLWAWILTSPASECVPEGHNCSRSNHRNPLNACESTQVAVLSY